MASCGHKSQTYYKAEEIKNTPYIVDVPANMRTFTSENKMLKLFRDESATGLVIMCTHMTTSEFKENARKDIKQKEHDFIVNINEFSDSLIWYRFSKGKVTGQCVYSLRTSPYINGVLTDEKIFIWYSGLGVTMDKAQTIINSIRVNIKTSDYTERTDDDDCLKTFSNDYVTISYPCQWNYIIEHPSDMTEVLIRSENEDVGMTIVRIETDETIDALVQMAINSNDYLHLNTSEPESMVISNCVAYAYVTSGVVGKDSIKHIAYSLKNKNMFYNLRIGMRPDWINTNQTLINKIASSFTIKEDY